MLKKIIQGDLIKSLKDRNEIASGTLRMLSAAILNKEKEKRARIAKELAGAKEEDLKKKSELRDEEIIEVVASEVKKRKEAALEFEKGKRDDLVKKEKAEIEILKKYLPEQLSEEELNILIKEAIEKVGAKEARDIGKVMAELMPKIKGKADAGKVSRIVKELLS